MNEDEHGKDNQKRDDIGQSVVEILNHCQFRLSGAANRLAQTRQSGGKLARRSVEIVDVIKRFKFALWDRLKRPFYRLNDIKKADTSVEEGMDRRLVRSVQHSWTSAAAKQSLPSDAQRWETMLV